MSADESDAFGTLMPDVRQWSHHAEETETTTERPAEAGAWPEEMDDVQFYAESALTLPGMGEAPPGCGEWLPMEFCDAGHVGMGSTSCQTRQCPDCWYPWAINRTTGIVERLAAARDAASSGLEKRVVHTVASPPPGEVKTLVDIKQGWHDAYDLAREQGVRGGVVVFHGFRVTDEAKNAFAELKDAEMVEGGIWRWVREHDRDWRSLTYWSPHWHVLGLSEDVAENKPEDQDGWVFKRVANKFSRWRLTDDSPYEEMCKVATYLLSHVSFDAEGSDHCIRWFGELANNQFNPEEALSPGRWSVIQRKTREAVGGPGEEDREAATDELGHETDERQCSCDGCTEPVSPIWDAGGALCDPGWCDRIGRDAERRLNVAFQWALGKIRGPPGMARAGSREEADELFDWLLEEHG